MTDRRPSAPKDTATGAASIVAAIVVTLAAIVPMLLLLPDAEDPLPAPVAEATSSTTTTTTLPEPVEVVVPPTPIEVEGLPESITRVLQASGYASEIGPDGEQVLPDAVLQVLIENDVVLTVVEDAEPADQGG